MGLRADRKKLQRQFKIGDVVTWGNGSIAHRVIEVRTDGVVVDASSVGQPKLFVPFYKKQYGTELILRHTDMEPDKLPR